MKYIKVEWPEIQGYMSHPNYKDEVGYDPIKDCYFVPEYWEEQYYEEYYKDEFSGGDIGDLEDAMG